MVQKWKNIYIFWATEWRQAIQKQENLSKCKEFVFSSTFCNM